MTDLPDDHPAIHEIANFYGWVAMWMSDYQDDRQAKSGRLIASVLRATNENGWLRDSAAMNATVWRRDREASRESGARGGPVASLAKW